MFEKACEALAGNYTKEQLEEAYEEIKELTDAGVLFSADDYEKFADMMVSAPIKSMCLHVAHDCNLRCKYCFASNGRFWCRQKTAGCRNR